MTLGTPTDIRVQRVGRNVLRWIWRVLVGIVALFLILIVSGLLYQWLASAADHRAYPPPGQLVDVGGHRLHMVCMGEGSPTVILDALGDGSSAQWGWVQPAVAEKTRVCAYDRAGRGWSEAGPLPRDGKTIAQELNRLLINGGIEGPIILVGHSFGGLVARIYAGQFPENVAGMVLVDPGLPSLRSERMPVAAREQAASEVEFMSVAPVMARLGLFRLLGSQTALPEPQRSYAQAIYASNRLWDSLKAEADGLPMTDAEVEETGSLGDLPLIVVAATRGWVDANAQTDESRQIYNTMLQEELLPLSTNSLYREVEGASHASLVMDEVDAVQVTAAILDVVGAVQSGAALQP